MGYTLYGCVECGGLLMEDACGVYLVWLCGVWWAFDGNALQYLHQAGNRESSVHCLHAHTHNESRIA